jgi:hypothetical protein
MGCYQQEWVRSATFGETRNLVVSGHLYGIRVLVEVLFSEVKPLENGSPKTPQQESELAVDKPLRTSKRPPESCRAPGPLAIVSFIIHYLRWQLFPPNYRLDSGNHFYDKSLSRPIEPYFPIYGFAVLRVLGATDRSVTLRVPGKQQPFL